MEYCTTGFLVTGGAKTISDFTYYGVDTDAWPIGDRILETLAPKIYENAYSDLSYPLLIDFDSATKYCSMCEREGETPRLLYCEAILNSFSGEIPECRAPLLSTFLGYDYAYPSGDYYSALFNDVIWDKGCLTAKWRRQLNRYGLLYSEDQMRMFVQDRITVSSRNVGDYAVELGNFVIFRVFGINCLQMSCDGSC